MKMFKVKWRVLETGEEGELQHAMNEGEARAIVAYASSRTNKVRYWMEPIN